VRKKPMPRGLSFNLIIDSEVSTRERAAIRQHNQIAACDLGKMTAVIARRRMNRIEGSGTRGHHRTWPRT
jgi:hypothetical protein